MRKINFKNKFNGVVIFNQTFPVFDDHETVKVLKKFHFALKNKGRIYIHTLNPFVYATKFERYYEWSETRKGFRLIKVNFDFLTQRVEGENYYVSDKVIREKENGVKSINFRIFTPMQWINFLRDSGFKDFKFYGSQKIPIEGFKVSSKELIVVAEKG